MIDSLESEEPEVNLWNGWDVSFFHMQLQSGTNTKNPSVCRAQPAEPIKLQPCLHPWNTIWGISGEIQSQSTDMYEHQQGYK